MQNEDYRLFHLLPAEQDQGGGGSQHKIKIKPLIQIPSAKMENKMFQKELHPMVFI